MTTPSRTVYPLSSPYAQTSINAGTYLDFMANRPITSNPADVYFVITTTYEYRPDLLAFDLYGNPGLWWVFAQRNPNVLGPDPYFNFTAGTGIFIPNITTLKQDLGI